MSNVTRLGNTTKADVYRLYLEWRKSESQDIARRVNRLNPQARDYFNTLVTKYGSSDVKFVKCSCGRMTNGNDDLHTIYRGVMYCEG